MITYKQNPQLDFQAVLEIYDSVGWTNYTDWPTMLQKALEHSLLVLAAVDGDRLVGLLRAVGDGYSIVLFRTSWFCQPISVRELVALFWRGHCPFSRYLSTPSLDGQY